MEAVLVDQITALYVVLAVAMVVFGGVFFYLWRLSALLRRGAGPYALGAGALIALLLGLGGLWQGKVIASEDMGLLAVLLAILVVWAGIFVYLWRLDNI